MYLTYLFCKLQQDTSLHLNQPKNTNSRILKDNILSNINYEKQAQDYYGKALS